MKTVVQKLVFERSGCSQLCVSDVDQTFFQHDAALKIANCATTSAKDLSKREKEHCRLKSTVRDVTVPIVRASSSSKLCHGISGIVKIKMRTFAAPTTSFFTSVQGVLFTQRRVNKVIGSFSGPFLDHHLRPSTSFEEIVPVGEEVTAPDRTCREVLRNVRHQFLSILSRLLLSITLAHN